MEVLPTLDGQMDAASVLTPGCAMDGSVTKGPTHRGNGTGWLPNVPSQGYWTPAHPGLQCVGVGPRIPTKRRRQLEGRGQGQRGSAVALGSPWSSQAGSVFPPLLIQGPPPQTSALTMEISTQPLPRANSEGHWTQRGRRGRPGTPGRREAPRPQRFSIHRLGAPPPPTGRGRLPLAPPASPGGPWHSDSESIFVKRSILHMIRF